jgi:hypothetical protein
MKLHPIFFKKENEINGYSETSAHNKQQFHTCGRALLTELARLLGIGEAAIRSNKGGIAVPGEVTLHSEQLYIQLHMASFAGAGARLLYRSCKGKQDYTGGQNHYFTVSALTDDEQLAAFLKRCKALTPETCPV